MVVEPSPALLGIWDERCSGHGMSVVRDEAQRDMGQGTIRTKYAVPWLIRLMRTYCVGVFLMADFAYAVLGFVA